jgi:hypothetical protein
MEEVANVGEIVVKVFRKGPESRLPPKAYPTMVNAVAEVAEKALKGKSLSHGTS